MYKLFFIAKNNMKKQKGDMITFFILTFIAAFLIFDCAAALLGLNKVLDERFEAVNGAEILLINGRTDDETECAKKAFEANEHIAHYEVTPVLRLTSDYKNKKESGDYSQYSFIIQSFEEEPEYMNLGIDQSTLKKNDILLPYFIKGTFPIGDTIQMKIDDEVYEFNVAGYAEDPYFCSSINVTIYYVYMSQQMMDEIAENHEVSVFKSNLHKGDISSAELEAGLLTDDVEHEISSEYKTLITPFSKSNPEGDYLNILVVNWQMMRGGSGFIPMIIMAVVMLFAVLILVISIVIISFSIKNFIQRNMKNTGILEASGYTVRELRNALTVQILLVAVIGSIIGIATSIFTFDKFGNVISSVLGLTWNQPVNVMAAVGTFLGIILVVYLVSRMISRAYNKVSVLDALRGGINTHNFKKNYFSFENTPLPISVVLSLKDTFGGMGRNLVMVFITVVLTVSALVGFGLYENFGKDAESLITFMGFELGDVAVSGDKELGEDLRDLDNVENVLGFYNIEPVVYKGDNEKTIAAYVYDDVENAKQTRVIEGRIPEKDNEIMLTGAAAEDLGVKVGDVVELELGEEKAKYLVVGLNQRMERMGRTIIMNMDAAEKITPSTPVVSYIISTTNGTSYETMKKEIRDYAEENDLDFDAMHITDNAKAMQATTVTITSSMKAVCVTIAFLTVLIVIFVESLVIRAKITRDWKGMGISKALGMTSGGLISQIMLANAPAIIMGILIGVIISRPAGAKLCLTIFSLFGMKSMDFNLPILWITTTALGILAVAFITSGLLGMKVRGLKPVEMITEE